MGRRGSPKTRPHSARAQKFLQPQCTEHIESSHSSCKLHIVSAIDVDGIEITIYPDRMRRFREEAAIVGTATRSSSLRKNRLFRSCRSALLVLAAGCIIGCKRSPVDTHRSAPAPVPSPKVPISSTIRPRIQNVFLITVDTLRADQPWAGYDKIETPNLSRLAARSVVYTRAYSVAHLTTLSLNGLLASRYPSGLPRTMCIFGRFDIEHSLAPTLQSADIQTFAAHGHALFAGDVAPSVGFDEWRLVSGAAGRQQTNGAVTGADTANLVVQYIENERPKSRLFAWAHFVDPHDSYVAHDDFPPASKKPRSLYDSEVAYTDSVIGKVLDTIERSGMAQSTAIVVTADHGESFGEHGSMRHGFTLYEEEIRVPLMVHIPGVEHRTIDVPRSGIDVAPTIVDLFGIEPPTPWDGHSLLSDLDADQPESRPIIVDVPAVDVRPPKRTVIRGSRKVIFTGTVAQVFDLQNDPKELSPLTDDAAKTDIESARTELDRIRTVEAKPCDQPKVAATEPEGA